MNRKRAFNVAREVRQRSKGNGHYLPGQSGDPSPDPSGNGVLVAMRSYGARV